MAALETFRRSELERRIEEMIALLDLLDDDADVEDGHDVEPTLGAENDHEGRSQEFWAQPSRLDECEAEDEHGGDILDEPHDDDELEENGDEQDCCRSEDEWHPLARECRNVVLICNKFQPFPRPVDQPTRPTPE